MNRICAQSPRFHPIFPPPQILTAGWDELECHRVFNFLWELSNLARKVQTVVRGKPGNSEQPAVPKTQNVPARRGQEMAPDCCKQNGGGTEGVPDSAVCSEGILQRVLGLHLDGRSCFPFTESLCLCSEEIRLERPLGIFKIIPLSIQVISCVSASRI